MEGYYKCKDVPKRKLIFAEQPIAVTSVVKLAARVLKVLGL